MVLHGPLDSEYTKSSKHLARAKSDHNFLSLGSLGLKTLRKLQEHRPLAQECAAQLTVRIGSVDGEKPDANLTDPTEFLDIMDLASLAKLLAKRPFSLSLGKDDISCFHPLTNEGYPDGDYLVLSVNGRETCDIWLFRGEIDIEATIERLRLFRVSKDSIDKIREIYSFALTKVSTAE